MLFFYLLSLKSSENSENLNIDLNSDINHQIEGINNFLQTHNIFTDDDEFFLSHQNEQNGLFYNNPGYFYELNNLDSDNRDLNSVGNLEMVLNSYESEETLNVSTDSELALEKKIENFKKDVKSKEMLLDSFLDEKEDELQEQYFEFNNEFIDDLIIPMANLTDKLSEYKTKMKDLINMFIGNVYFIKLEEDLFMDMLNSAINLIHYFHNVVIPDLYVGLFHLISPTFLENKIDIFEFYVKFCKMLRDLQKDKLNSILICIAKKLKLQFKTMDRRSLEFLCNIRYYLKSDKYKHSFGQLSTLISSHPYKRIFKIMRIELPNFSCSSVENSVIYENFDVFYYLSFIFLINIKLEIDEIIENATAYYIFKTTPNLNGNTSKTMNYIYEQKYKIEPLINEMCEFKEIILSLNCSFRNE